MSALSTMAAVSTCAPTAQMEAIIAPVTEVFFFTATENNAEVNYEKTLWINLSKLPCKFMSYSMIAASEGDFAYCSSEWRQDILWSHTVASSTDIKDCPQDRLSGGKFYPDYMEQCYHYMTVRCKLNNIKYKLI